MCAGASHSNAPRVEVSIARRLFEGLVKGRFASWDTAELLMEKNRPDRSTSFNHGIQPTAREIRRRISKDIHSFSL
ncbi:hypothetical protein L210DRAFT_3525039, partial [Boletus edulis BED1]